MVKKNTTVRRWWLVDARGKVLGRLSTRVATILMGKHRPEYTPHVDPGDPVVVIHAGEIKLTGKKMTDKIYTFFSGYPGGLRRRTAGEMLLKHADQVVIDSVRRMLPKSRLGRKMLGKLKVYAGELPAHGYKAQGLSPMEL